MEGRLFSFARPRASVLDATSALPFTDAMQRHVKLGIRHVVLCICFAVAVIRMMGCASDSSKAQIPGQPAHHAGYRIRNVPLTRKHRAGAFFKWQLGFGPKETPPKFDGAESYEAQVVEPDVERIGKPAGDRIQITWLGHATFLIQINGLNLLTDPVFKRRCSPVSFTGPKRVVPPALSLDQLPRIDALLISHSHYDHLEKLTVKRLGKNARIYAPLRVGEWLRKRGCRDVVELDWWQSGELGGLRFHCVPAQHFSGRKPWGHDTLLWCGWVVESPQGKAYFAGDTGYGRCFKRIGERLGPMRIALIPIGCYLPRWFMRPVHATPEDAIRIHQDVRTEKSIGMHWGTFDLSDEPIGEPPLRLKAARKEAGITEAAFGVMKFGETRAY